MFRSGQWCWHSTTWRHKWSTSPTSSTQFLRSLTSWSSEEQSARWMAQYQRRYTNYRTIFMSSIIMKSKRRSRLDWPCWSWQMHFQLWSRIPLMSVYRKWRLNKDKSLKKANSTWSILDFGSVWRQSTRRKEWESCFWGACTHDLCSIWWMGICSYLFMIDGLLSLTITHPEII